LHEVCFASTGSYLKLRFWPIDDDGRPIPAVEYTLVVEGPLQLRLAGSDFEITPDSSPHPACLELVGRKVLEASATDGGELRLTLDDGDRLTIPSDKFEPWHLSGDDGYLLVSVAGGGLS
jgi:hypothetical protein